MCKPSITQNLYSGNGPYADLCRIWSLRLYHSSIAKGYDIKELVQRQFGEVADPGKPDQLRRLLTLKGHEG